MKNGMKKTALLVLSCASLATAIGYSSWIIESNKTYLINNRDIASKPVAYIVGNEKVKYTTIEKALDVAQSGDIVCVITVKKTDKTKLNYQISKDCTIKKGVTLLIPTDEESVASVKDDSSLQKYIQGMAECNNDQGNATSFFAGSDKLRITVSIASGTTLTNKGTLVVGGYLSGGTNNAGRIGQTAFSYSKIVLGRNSAILQDDSDAKAHCFGYIEGSASNDGSQVTILKGSLYVPFVVDDYKGFNASYAMSRGAVSKEGCSPFNQFELPNVATKTKIAYGGMVKGIVNAYFKFPQLSVDEVAHKTLDLVGNTSSDLIQLNNQSSYLEFTFDGNSHLQRLDIHNGCALNNLPFSLKVSGFTADMNTQTAYFPIGYNLSVNLVSDESPASFDFSKQMLKLLPGSSMKIGKGSSVKCSSLVSYSAFVDGETGNSKYTKFSLSESTKYPLKEGALLVIEDGASLSGSSVGGTIYCNDENQIQVTTKSVTAKEPWTIGSGSSITDYYAIKDYLEISENLFIVPVGNSPLKKVFFFSNSFSSTNSYKPETDLYVDDALVDSIKGTQKVIFVDEASKLRMDFKKNVYMGFVGDLSSDLETYSYESEYSIGNLPIVGVANSSLSISSSNNGVNEFEVQSISIKSTQDKIDGKDPLFVDGTLGLSAAIEDDSKVYNPVVRWSSSNEEIATVSQDGVVTGVKLGKVRITATCHGKTAAYDTEVIPDGQITEPTNMWIQSSNGKKGVEMTGAENYGGTANNGNNDFKYHEKVTKNTTITFSLILEPQDAFITGVEWSYKAWGGKSYMHDPNDANKQINDGSTIIGGTNDASIKQVQITYTDNTGASPDSETLTCKVHYGDGKTTTLTFVTDYDKAACFAIGTPILLEDGTCKNIEKLTYEDRIMTWNFFTGKLEAQPIAILVDHGEDFYRTAELAFSNGTKVSIIADHGFFDYNLNKFVYLTPENAGSYLHHKFATTQGEDFECVELIGVSISEKLTHAYSLTSAFNYNAIANGMLTCPPPGKFYNWISIGDKLRYDNVSFEADVQRYGLYDYFAFEPYGISYETFIAFNGQYLKIPVEKGIFSFDYIIELFNMYKGWIE